MPLHSSEEKRPFQFLVKITSMETAVPSNEEVIRELYHVAEAASKDTKRFVSLFWDDGYFWDAGSDVKFYGNDIGNPVDGFVAAFPDMHRELHKFYTVNDNTIMVELTLVGKQDGDLRLPGGILPATGKQMKVPCCDVFYLKDGKVTAFHCYNAAAVLLAQLGALGNLTAALRRD